HIWVRGRTERSTIALGHLAHGAFCRRHNRWVDDTEPGGEGSRVVLGGACPAADDARASVGQLDGAVHPRRKERAREAAEGIRRCCQQGTRDDVSSGAEESRKALESLVHGVDLE